MTIDQPPLPPLLGPTRATITEAEVVKAAEQLQAGGTRPTALKIREILGRGSPNTIQPWLEAWRAGKAAPTPIPEDLAAEATRRGGEALLALLQTFWPRLRDRIARDFEERLKDAAGASEEAAEELTSATAAIERLEAELAAAAQDRLTQDQAYAALSHERAELLARIGQQDAQALLHSQALAQSTALADRAAGDLAAAEARHRERLQVLDGRLRDAEAATDLARAETASVRDQLHARSLEAQRLTDQLQHASDQLEAMRNTVMARDLALEQLGRTRDQLTAEITANQVDLSDTQQQLAIAQTRLSTQEDERRQQKSDFRTLLEHLRNAGGGDRDARKHA